VSRAWVALAALLFVSCGGAGSPDVVSPSAPAPLAVRGTAPEDTAPKANLRMVPPEAYMRTYLQLFGGLAPLDAQRLGRGKDGGQLFDTWDDYVSALGFPDYRLDIPRQTQTNAVMIASFERLGIALCDRALEHDLTGMTGKPPPPVVARLIYAFELPSGDVDLAGFTARFDVLHRTFLGYPASLAPPQRAARFFQLYRDVESDHAQKKQRSRFTPAEAGWAAVCYGLVRHPEFHLY
jgi:hypothetical protein